GVGVGLGVWVGGGGGWGEAEAAATAALAASPEGEPSGRLRWVLAQSCLSQGRTPAALAEAERALAAGDLTRAERARFHGLAAQCVHVLSATGSGPRMLASQQARDEALASGDAHAMAYGLQAVAGASRWQGRFGDALDLADQAAEALRRAGPIVDSQLDPDLIPAHCLFHLHPDPEAGGAHATRPPAAQPRPGP